MAEPDRVSEHEKVADHVAAGLALLTEQFKGKPRVEGLLGVFLEQVQALEDALWQLLTETDLDASVGAQLDQLGALLVESRDGLSDANYRTILRAKILALRSGGTGNELLTLTDLVITGAFTLTEYFPAGIVVEVADPIVLPAARVLALLKLAKAGGVRLQLAFPPGLPGFPMDAFEFAAGELVETDAAHGWSDVTESTGGAFAGVLE